MIQGNKMLHLQSSIERKELWTNQKEILSHFTWKQFWKHQISSSHLFCLLTLVQHVDLNQLSFLKTWINQAELSCCVFQHSLKIMVLQTSLNPFNVQLSSLNLVKSFLSIKVNLYWLHRNHHLRVWYGTIN